MAAVEQGDHCKTHIQLESGANCLTPDSDTFQLFHTSQITIIMDPVD